MSTRKPICYDDFLHLKHIPVKIPLRNL